MMRVPFVDLRAKHDELRTEIDVVLRQAIDESSFIGGPSLGRFEEHFAAYCGAAHAAGCASGTDALKLALMAAGVGPGVEVITVPHTFIATVEAITTVGAQPAFIDIEPTTYCMSAERLAQLAQDVRPQGPEGRGPTAVATPQRFRSRERGEAAV